MIGFIVGLCVGFGSGVLLAIYWPKKWKRVMDEAEQEINDRLGR